MGGGSGTYGSATSLNRSCPAPGAKEHNTSKEYVLACVAFQGLACMLPASRVLVLSC